MNYLAELSWDSMCTHFWLETILISNIFNGKNLSIWCAELIWSANSISSTFITWFWLNQRTTFFGNDSIARLNSILIKRTNLSLNKKTKFNAKRKKKQQKNRSKHLRIGVLWLIYCNVRLLGYNLCQWFGWLWCSDWNSNAQRKSNDEFHFCVYLI